MTLKHKNMIDVMLIITSEFFIHLVFSRAKKVLPYKTVSSMRYGDVELYDTEWIRNIIFWNIIHLSKGFQETLSTFEIVD